MPHALSMPAPGFQAVILCGPGVSYDTFTSKPEESPKALIPIANRPMVWYPLDFCYRMGITKTSHDRVIQSAHEILDITLISPPASAPAITAALNTNPHLTALPLPSPDLLAPEGLDQTTGTAQILRLPEVRQAITGDFIVLPCDLVCELSGESLLETWMVKEAGLGGATGGGDEFTGPKMSIGGEKGGRRGGLGVWYKTGGEGSVKGEETDFIATSSLPQGPVPPPVGSLLPHVSNLVYSVPTDTLNDIIEEKKGLPLRRGLMRKYSKIRMLSSHRDAHIYIFPAWVMNMINQNEQMDNLSEDVVGWWAKAGWQEGLAEKLGLKGIFEGSNGTNGEDLTGTNNFLDEDIDIGSLSTTWATSMQTATMNPSPPSSASKSAASQPVDGQENNRVAKVVVPPILAYLHPPNTEGPLIRRVDTAPLLLMVSLQLAKLESVEQVGRHTSSPFAHARKVAYPEGIAPKCTVTRPDCLLAENVTVEERSAIKECVIGANCQICEGAKLTRCVLMDGVVVGKGCKITGSILGRRTQIGDESVLQDCEVEDNMRIEAKNIAYCCGLGFNANAGRESTAEAKNEKFKSSEGLEEAFEDEVIEPLEEIPAQNDSATATV